MAAAPFRISARKILEDPLAYLPWTRIASYHKGETIYGPNQPCHGISLVVEGKVITYRNSDTGKRFVVDIYGPEEIFGLCSLVGIVKGPEETVAFGNTKIMTWTPVEVEQLATHKPQLALALVQALAARSLDYSRAIARGPVESIEPRLLRALLRFGQRFGVQNQDGLIHIPAFTHQLLSEHMGTSRVIISRAMNHFRRGGLMRYSRKEICLDTLAIKAWLPEAHR
ncbi:MAG: Crp/Fnr family transcriptional regulator [Bryobacteraceae bacterium]